MSTLEANVQRLDKSVATLTGRVTAHEQNLQAAVTELQGVITTLKAQGTADQTAIDRLSTLADTLDAFDPDVPATTPAPTAPDAPGTPPASNP